MIFRRFPNFLRRRRLFFLRSFRLFFLEEPARALTMIGIESSVLNEFYEQLEYFSSRFRAFDIFL